MYTHTNDRTVTYKGQTRPLVREGVTQRQNSKFQAQTLEKEAVSGQTSTKWALHQDILTLSSKVILTLSAHRLRADQQETPCPTDA
jgi:hypothetical protein